MVNKEGAQFWRYDFENNLPEDHLLQQNQEKLSVYDFSEEKARAAFEKVFKVKAAKIIGRVSW